MLSQVFRSNIGKWWTRGNEGSRKDTERQECQGAKGSLSAEFALNIETVFLDVQCSQPSLREHLYSDQILADIARKDIFQSFQTTGTENASNYERSNREYLPGFGGNSASQSVVISSLGTGELLVSVCC